jgi:hypothetical protein
LTLWTTAGGNFNALPAPSAVAVGTVKLTFLDCVTATLEYAFNANGSDVSGTVPLVRLIPNVTCSTSADDLTRADFGHSGNWFDPAISGQGFVFELNPIAEVIFFTWQTYSLSGAQRWFTGVGDYVPGSRTLPVTLYETTGGLFDSVEPAARTAVVGAATVTFLVVIQHSSHSPFPRALTL